MKATYSVLLVRWHLLAHILLCVMLVFNGKEVRFSQEKKSCKCVLDDQVRASVAALNPLTDEVNGAKVKCSGLGSHVDVL